MSQAQSSSISRSLGLYVFPAEGQDAAQQDADEAECFKWAKQQSGYDPLNPTVAVAAEVDRSADGSAIGGAAVGAAGGAAIGAIAGDAGKGAAIGAASGALIGGMRRRDQQRRQAQAEQQWAQEQAAQYNQRRGSYNRAYSACLEGRGYTVK